MLRRVLSGFIAFISVQALATIPGVLPLDTHVHFDFPELSFYALDPDEVPGQEGFLLQDRVQKAFLISPSYSIWQDRHIQAGWPAHLAPLGDLTNRMDWDRQISDFISAHSDRFIGLCGLNIHWPDAVQIVTACLGLPHMKGIKLHTEASRHSLQDPLVRQRVQEVFAAVERTNPFVLWHLSAESVDVAPGVLSNPQYRGRELTALWDIARSFPKITFISAHGLVGGGASPIDFSMAGAVPENFYLEISNIRDLPEAISHWRYIGTNKVLFGSDLGFASNQNYINERIAQIETTPLLTQEEKLQILVSNGQAILLRLGLQ